MNVHFIAIGGSAMHNLAIALKEKGYHVTGSDDEIREPSRSRLQRKGILPEHEGWNPDLIHHDLDAVILGMHAREDNPELLRATELGLRIFSYPEYLYEASKDKIRVVIGGSHGKTSITSMLLHAAKALQKDFDYMVGAQLDGYDCMVKISDSANVMILEGDEYLSSPIDRRPKFHLYKPDIALLSGIAWDHINVFPTFENYVQQFEVFVDCIQAEGSLIYFKEDPELQKIVAKKSEQLKCIPYTHLDYSIENGKTIVHFNGKDYPLEIFGRHNLQNLNGAMLIALELGFEAEDFLKSMQNFTGAGKRLEKVVANEHFVMFKDFAHSPSKLKATTNAVKEQFSDRKLIACMELHTFSSLNKSFLEEYKGSMEMANDALVYFNHAVVSHKKLEGLSKETVSAAFGGRVEVADSTEEVLRFINSRDLKNSVLLMMSSGNFDGIDFDKLGEKLLEKSNI